MTTLSTLAAHRVSIELAERALAHRDPNSVAIVGAALLALSTDLVRLAVIESDPHLRGAIEDIGEQVAPCVAMLERGDPPPGSRAPNLISKVRILLVTLVAYSDPEAA